MKSYDDIIELPRPEPKKHPRMPQKNRAAQFAPFAALSGFEDEIKAVSDEMQSYSDAEYISFDE